MWFELVVVNSTLLQKPSQLSLFLAKVLKDRKDIFIVPGMVLGFFRVEQRNKLRTEQRNQIHKCQMLSTQHSGASSAKSSGGEWLNLWVRK